MTRPKGETSGPVPRYQFSTSVEVRLGIVGWLVGNSSVPFSQKTALRIFLIFCMKLDINKGKKVTKPDFEKKNWFIHKVRKFGQNDGFSTFSQKWL